jgi:hypothetical protein
MKTAMQELIDELDLSKIVNRDKLIMVKYIIAACLEKEKEQIINGHWAGWEDAYDYLREDNNDRARQAEEYYEETYNQNK